MQFRKKDGAIDLCSFSRWQPEVCDGKKTTEIGLDIFFKGVETRNYHGNRKLASLAKGVSSPWVRHVSEIPQEDPLASDNQTAGKFSWEISEIEGQPWPDMSGAFVDVDPESVGDFNLCQ